jgi:hypothetical protein
MQRLIEYITRCPFRLVRMVTLTRDGKILYRAALIKGADSRDAFREMLLGDAVRHKKILSLNEMSRFEGTSRENELRR